MNSRKKHLALALGAFAFIVTTQVACAFYDPNLGRWINRDPLGEKGGVNLYSFVHNAPVQGIDPNGLYPGGSAGEALYHQLAQRVVLCVSIIYVQVDFDHTKPLAPKHRPEDEFFLEAHCVANCRIARECPGRGMTAYFVSMMKEKMRDRWGGTKPWYAWGDEPDSPPDYDANKVGRTLAGRCKDKSCEELCRGALPGLVNKWQGWREGDPPR